MIMTIILSPHDFNLSISLLGKAPKKCKFNIFLSIEHRMLCLIKEISKTMITNVNKLTLIRSTSSYLHRPSVDVTNNNPVNVNQYVEC